MDQEKLKEKQEWVHVLPDRLTAKTNCELRLEVYMSREMFNVGKLLEKKLRMIQTHALSQHGWETLMEQIASLDFQPLQEFSIEGGNYSFRYPKTSL